MLMRAKMVDEGGDFSVCLRIKNGVNIEAIQRVALYDAKVALF